MIIIANMANILDKIKNELNFLAAKDSLRDFHLCSRQGKHVLYQDKQLLNFASWDFFDLRFHPEMQKAAQEAIQTSGTGTSSPRLVCGTQASHLRCEKRLAEFFGTESAVLFSSKNQAVLSLIVSLVNETDQLLSDEEIQSPVSDAAYLVNADAVVFSPAKPDSLEKTLEENPCLGKRFVFVESVSPYLGRRVDLKAVTRLAKKHQATLIVDESFALAVLGPRGAGGIEDTLLSEEIFCIYGTLSTSLASFGAFVSGSKMLKDYLCNFSRTFRTEASLPCSVTQATIKAIDLIELMIEGRQKLTFLSAKLQEGLKSIGIEECFDSSIPIACIPVKDFSAAKSIQGALIKKGFLVEAVSRTSFLEESGIIRILVNHSHSEEQIQSLLNAIYEIYARLSDS